MRVRAKLAMRSLLAIDTATHSIGRGNERSERDDSASELERQLPERLCRRAAAVAAHFSATRTVHSGLEAGTFSNAQSARKRARGRRSLLYEYTVWHMPFLTSMAHRVCVSRDFWDCYFKTREERSALWQQVQRAIDPHKCT